ncbi:MAG: Gfo/Idh/MocA family oxidoreductase [Phycisphaerales bacterium]
MIKAGIIGLGFMGKMHFRCYKSQKNVKVAAICDIDEKKFTNTSGTAGNISGADKPLDFTGISFYTDFDKMLKNENLDVVSVTLPTYLHCKYSLKALNAGVNTFCEKPMAMTIGECKKMTDAAKASKKLLQIGHCIRFWPEYAKLKEIIDSGKYGKVMAATFQRLSLTPTWSWNNWLMDKNKSGGAALDLHVHDSDFIQYLFGMPKEVFSQGVKGPSKDYDHIVTSYIFKDGKVVTAEGGWIMNPGFGFEMSFNVALENATISYNCTQTPTFKIAPAKGKVIIPKVAKGDGYSCELQHFIKAVSKMPVPEIITPKASLDSVKLLLAEKKSCASGKKISLK